jgi:hypothetical protein
MIVVLVIQSIAVTITQPTNSEQQMPKYFSAGWARDGAVGVLAAAPFE